MDCLGLMVFMLEMKFAAVGAAHEPNPVARLVGFMGSRLTVLT